MYPRPPCDAQDPAYDAGDCVQDLPIDWVRYDDPEVRSRTFPCGSWTEQQYARARREGFGAHTLCTGLSQVKAFKLNAERNNGRAAMFGAASQFWHATQRYAALLFFRMFLVALRPYAAPPFFSHVPWRHCSPSPHTPF